MSGIRVSDAGAASDPGGIEDLSIPELVSSLRSSFQKADFERVENILVEREESLNAAVRSNFSEELTLKEIEKMKLEAKIETLERELDRLRGRNAELEERAKETEMGFRVSSAEQRKQREATDSYGVLEAKLGEIQAMNMELLCAKRKAEIEVMDWKRKYGELQARSLRLVEENMHLKAREEETLKNVEEDRGIKAEIEVMDWKRKYGELQARSLRLVEDNLYLKAREEETLKNVKEEGMETVEEDKVVEEPNKPSIIKNCEDWRNRLLPKLEVGSERKGDATVKNKLGPVIRGIIEISDSEDEMDAMACDSRNQNMGQAVGTEEVLQKGSEKLHLDITNEAMACTNSSSSEENFLSTLTPKRGRSSKVITSDSESSEDDKTEKLKMRKIEVEKPMSSTTVCSPINSFTGDDHQELITPSRRRLVPLRQCREAKGCTKGTSPRNPNFENLSPTNANNVVSRKSDNVYKKIQYPVTENVKEDGVHGEKDVEHVGSDSSESEGESLGGFIVNESDASGNECSSSNSSEQEVSNSSLDQVFSRIRREKKITKWEYEADMLASFAKDPEICMKAVCALYRQQTVQEQTVKGSLVVNNRGFNKLDAIRGSRMADFLTDGDPNGLLTKTVQELNRYDPEGCEYCYKLAAFYSKQLFMIYLNKEDPYFLPS